MKQVQNMQNRSQVCTKIQYKQDNNQEINSIFALGGLYLRKNCTFKKLECFHCGKIEHVNVHCKTKMTNCWNKQQRKKQDVIERKL